MGTHLLENVGLDRGRVTKRSNVGGVPINFESDMVEAIAIAMIHASNNAELRERVRQAMKGAQTNKKQMIYLETDSQTPGRPEYVADITAGAGGVLLIGPNTDPDWKRVQVGIHAEVTNVGNLYVAIAGDDIDNQDSWPIEPGDNIQIELPDASSLWALSDNGTEDLRVWQIGAGVPPELGNLV